jgi:hypothetical protein
MGGEMNTFICVTDWIRTEDRLPEEGQMVWLHDGTNTWIGSREHEGDGWLWGNSYGNIWHNGAKWDGDCETDDDYKPTHWLPLPELPNTSATCGAGEQKPGQIAPGAP